MTVGIGAGGFMGIAFETTPNTYQDPTKFFPIRSENLKYEQKTVWRRVIRGVADVLGGVAGNVGVSGTIEIEALPDVVPYFMYAARTSISKTGTGPYTYSITGTASAQGNRTLSVTVVRNGIVFGYTGIQVSAFKFTVDNGLLVLNMDVLGSDEAVQSVPVAAFTNQDPFGAGTYNIQVPTATQVFDMDQFSFEVDDHGEHQYRLKNTGRGAQFTKYGERDAHLTCTRDFESRAEYDAFKALTAQSITVAISAGANASIDLRLPVAIKDTYEINGLSGQGDLIRASINYIGTFYATALSAYWIVAITTENIT